MAHQDYLALIAEIAAAFAGFTGIVAVFRFRAAQWQSQELVYFATMLRASLSALFLSLLTYLLFLLTVDEPIGWRFAAGAVTLVMSLNLYWFVVAGGLFRMQSWHWMLFPIGSLIAVSNLLAVLNVLPATTTVPIALTFQLYVAAHNFVILVMTGSEELETLVARHQTQPEADA